MHTSTLHAHIRIHAHAGCTHRMWDMQQTHPPIHTYTRIHHTQTYTHAHTHTQAHTHTRTHTRTHTHTHTQDCTCRLWDLEYATCIRSIIGHSDACRSVFFVVQCVHPHSHAHKHIHTHAHTRARTHAHVCVFALS